ncbi:cupin domain-containing protein [Ornithinimicrobium faecis]|uniref:cupin domain-containing protein n=1 Tax=Ornithinimicrobium faecis TaxID=2934158 RepID=UPI0021193BE9|nr:cupin domain-containing protein [Ornithinimicrobium sp. HY1745]
MDSGLSQGSGSPKGPGLPLAEPQRAEPEDLSALGAQLLQEATERPNGLRTRPVVRGPLLQSVLFALREGSQLPEHESPPAATLQVLRGEVVLVAGGERWTLHAGDLLPIPPERHHVDALTDAVCLLTIARP